MSVDAALAYSLSLSNQINIELCKHALERGNNDKIAAQVLLDKWRINDSFKNKHFGVVGAYFDKEQSAAVVLKATCTNEEFAHSREFYEFASSMTKEVMLTGKPQITSLAITQLENKYNCTINIKYDKLEKSSEYSLLTIYNHRDSISTVVETEVQNKEAFLNKKFRLFSFDTALHITVYAPLAISALNITQALKHQAMNHFEKQLASENKDMRFWAAAINNKYTSWVDQCTLLNQNFIKSNKEIFEVVRKKISDQIGSDIIIKKFTRLSMDN